VNTQIQVEHFVPSDIALRLALSLGVGPFVRFEREWSKKEMGVRSFAITCLLGTLSALIGETFALVSLATVGLLIIFANVRNLMRDQNPKITTSVSLVVTAVLGVLIGQGHLFTPIAAAILLTLILSLKTEFSTFAVGLRPEEIRSAVLLGLLGFVIYPVRGRLG